LTLDRILEVRMSGSKRVGILAILTLLAVVAGGVLLWRLRRNEDADHRLVLYGNVDIRQVDLAFKGSERIAEMLAQEGDRVEKGQLLARLETHRLKAAVAHSRAQRAAQAQVVARLEAGSRPQEIRKAQAESEAAKADADNAAIDYHRLEVLLKQDATTQQNVDNAQARTRTAEANWRAAKEALDLVVAGPREEDIAAAQATLQAYQAQLTLAERDLVDANLHAPTAGVIQNRILEPGDMASPQVPVYTLALTDPVWVRAYVPGPNLGRIHPGMLAVVSTDSYPGKTYDAWVGFISPTAEFTPKSVETAEVRTTLVYQVRVYVKNPNDELRLGMPATVTIPLTVGEARD
jgi:HlyD family secretion protein